MIAPYGSWPSSITSELLVDQTVSLSDVRVADGVVWWIERRAAEKGRQVVVAGGVDRLPEGSGFSARTRVHEYGGAPYAVHGGTLFFCNDADQRVWRDSRPITPDDGARYADLTVTPDGRSVLAVRERGDVNDLVAIPADGGGEPEVIAEGRDFYSAPRPSPDGSRLAYLCWDHPNMPWDGTELWVDGRRLAGGPDESISQPRWSPDGRLHWVSDRTGWWNLYNEGGPVLPDEAEYTGPDWLFGQSTYTFLPDGRLVAVRSEDGIDRLGQVDLPFTSFSSLAPLAGSEVVVIAASPRHAPAVVAIDVDTGTYRVIKASRATPPPAGALSEPRPIEFPTSDRATAHALHYPPRLDGYEGPPGERPPLLVRIHGGPTGAASSALNLEIQYWTSRGFAVVDVNYRGSTGYGRAYRRALDGQWGVADLDDCVNAARYLADAGHADPDRLLIRGGSAGGYTVLCALAFRPGTFAAGASYYGVADIETLARDTHKFESRYIDRLVPREKFAERSPIHRAGDIRSPVILFQGLEDKVVPPSQADALAAALRQNRVPFAYVTFEDEQHGFRQASTIRRSIEAELWFYGQVLGFQPSDEIEPVEIENRERLNHQVE